MKTRIGFCNQLALIMAAVATPLLLTSCASDRVAIDPVGPKPPVVQVEGGQGTLVVYTATEERRLDKGLPYQLHTGYQINTPDGKAFKWVPNHAGDMDQTVQNVRLPAGDYQIVAQSLSYGRINVPVAIRSSQTTEVHLDKRWTPGDKAANNTDLVKMPNGWIVGWRAASIAKAN